MKRNSFVEGTLVATLTLIIIKILGALYVIPFYNIVGESGGALYSYAYTIYSLVLDLCTAGIPLAISKIVSEYNTLEMYEAKERTLKLGSKIVFIMSVILFFALFVFSDQAAYIFKGSISGGNTLEEISLVIRSISFSMLIIPLLAIKKGYLQGQKFITLSTNSQLIEQIVRIAFVLVGSYFAINVFSLDISIGVSIAVFGSFISGIAAYIYLNIKTKKNIKDIVLPKEGQVDKVSNKTIYKKIISYSVPLILIAGAADLYNVTDLALIIRGLSIIGYNGVEAETVASVMATWASKICLIVNAIAYALGISLIPYMVSSLVKKDYKAVNSYFVKAIGTMIVIGLPLSVGICLLSNEVYFLFYGASKYGGIVLRLLPFSILISNINFVINAALQSLGKYKIIYKSTILGLLLNVLLDVPFIIVLDKVGIYPYYGAIFATLVGLAVSIIISTRALKKNMDFRYKDLFSISVRTVYPCLIMSAIVLVIMKLCGSVTTRSATLIPIGISAIAGGLLYFLIIYKNKVLFDVLGEEYINKILIKLKLKKKS